MTASDLIDGNSSFIGRPNAYLPGAKESRREATITYSDFNNPEATKVRYSSFNYALSNYKDLNEEFGGIDYMMNESGDVLVLQNERVSMVPRAKRCSLMPLEKTLLWLQQAFLTQPKHSALGQAATGTQSRSLLPLRMLYSSRTRLSVKYTSTSLAVESQQSPTRIWPPSLGARFSLHSQHPRNLATLTSESQAGTTP